MAAKNGAQLAVDEINALGGDIQFELMTEDDVNDPETSVNAYNALMDDGMQILVGSVTIQARWPPPWENYEDRIVALPPPPLPGYHRWQGQHVPDVLHGPQPGFRFRSLH